MNFEIDLREKAGSLQKQIEGQGYIIHSEKLYELEERRYSITEAVKAKKLDENEQRELAEIFMGDILRNVIYVGGRTVNKKELMREFYKRVAERNKLWDKELSKNLEYYIGELECIQASMEKKALIQDKSIIMDVFRLDEIINIMKTEAFE